MPFMAPSYGDKFIKTYQIFFPVKYQLMVKIYCEALLYYPKFITCLPILN